MSECVYYVCKCVCVATVHIEEVIVTLLKYLVNLVTS